MQVSEIMTKDVIAVRTDTPVTEVARLFRENAISGMPVVDDENDLVGIVTEVDLIARHARPHFPAYIRFLDGVLYLGSTRRYRESMRHILAATAGELMTSPVRTVPPEMDVQDLAAFMVDHRVNPVPVVDDEHRVVGIVSHSDVLAMIAQVEISAEGVDTASEPGEQ